MGGGPLEISTSNGSVRRSSTSRFLLNRAQSLVGWIYAVDQESERDLQTSEHRRIVRLGDTVRRPTGWWTPAVQTVLQHGPLLRSLDRHATYIVSAFIAGVTRPA